MMPRVARWSVFLMLAVALCAIVVNSLFLIVSVTPASNSYLTGTTAFNATAQNDTQNITWIFTLANGAYSVVRNITISACVNITGSNTTRCSFAFNTATLTDGVYNITVNATNSSNATGVTNVTTNITIDNTQPTIVLGALPLNSTNHTTPVLRFNWTVIDGFDTQPNCSLRINNTLYNGSVNVFNNTEFSVVAIVNGSGPKGANGTSYWNVTCSDSGGNVNTSANGFFTIDLVGPEVTSVVAYPTGKTAGNASDTVTLNVTLSGELGVDNKVTVLGANVCNSGNVSLSEVLGSASTRFTGSCAINSTSTEGNNSLTIHAEDRFGNRNTTQSLVVRVDRIPPGNVTLVNTAGMNFTSRTVTLNWTVKDTQDPTMACDVNLNGTVINASVVSQNSTNASNNTFVSYLTTSDGAYNWNVTCSDDALQTNFSATNTFRVTTLGPVIFFNEPSSVNKSFNDTFQLNITASNAIAVSRAVFEILNQTNLAVMGTVGRAMTNLAGEYWNATINVTNLTQGYFIARVNVTDNNSLTNVSNRTFTVDTTPPAITAFSLSDTTVTVGDSITSSCTATDNFAGVTTSVTGIDTTSAGTRSATCTATDGAGNVNSTTVGYTVEAASSGGGSSSSSDSGGGGGSGGSGATYSAVAGSTVGESSVSAGEETTLDIPKYDGIAFGAITFTPTEDLKDIEITVRRYATAPIGSEPIEELTYQYIRIDEKNIEGVTSAKIAFKVAKEWLDTNKILKDEISLYRWTGSAWAEFKASVKSEDTTHVFYEATVSGLSIFAIGKSSTAPDRSAEEPEAAPAATPEPVAAPASKGGNTGWIIAIVVLVLIVGVGYYWYRKNR